MGDRPSWTMLSTVDLQGGPKSKPLSRIVVKSY